jgi:hypothetical protein
MPEKSLHVALDKIPTACDWLNSEVEQLKAQPKRITKISYPRSLASTLGIIEHGTMSRYDGLPAEPNTDVPYVIVIEFED